MQDSDKLLCLVIDSHNSRLITEKECFHFDSGKIISFKVTKNLESLRKDSLPCFLFDACVLICKGTECAEFANFIRIIFDDIPVISIVGAREYAKYKEKAQQYVDAILLAEPITEDELLRTIVRLSKDTATLHGMDTASGTEGQTPEKEAPEIILYPQSLYERIVESSPNLVCRVLPDATLTFVNNTYSSFFGKTKEELIGMNLSRFMSSEDFKAILALYKRLTPQNTRELYVQKIISAGGETMWFEWLNHGEFDESGNLSEVQAIGKDITKEHVSAEVIRYHKDRLETLFKFASAGIVFTSLKYDIERANPAFCKMFGYKEEEVIGKKLPDLVPVKGSSGNGKSVFPSFSYIHGVKLTFIGKDCLEVPVSLSLIPFKDNSRLTGLCVVYRDLTVYRQREKALSISKTVIENSPVIIFTWKAEEGWPVEYVSENVSVLGYSPQEMTAPGWLYSSIVHPDDLPRIEGETRRHIEDRKTSFEYEYRIILKNGEIKWVMEKNTPEFDSKGRIIHFTGVIIDDTRRINTQVELEKSHENLKELFKQTIEALAETVVTRDPYTASHQKRVALLSVAIGRKLGLDEDRCEGLYLAAVVHDIGKISIPAEILSKPSKLSDIEMKLIRVHPEKGYDILKGVKAPWPLAEIVYQHHERIDGSGYPRGLRADEILMEARIIAVADIVEACASHRPYRPALGMDEALRIVTEARGVTLDADVVDACIALFKDDGFTIQPEE